MAPFNFWLLLGGIILLVLLKVFRNRFRYWARDETNFFTVGYFLPLLGLSLVLLGMSGFRSGHLYLLPDPLELALKVVFGAGLMLMLLAVATIFGLRMPSIMLPRWAREPGARKTPEPDLANPQLMLVDRARSVSVSVPGFSEDWKVARSRPAGTLIAATAREPLASGHAPTVTVTRCEAGGGEQPALADAEPATVVGEAAVRTTTRATVDGRELTTWTWTLAEAGLCLAVRCASADAAAYEPTAAAIATSLTRTDAPEPHRRRSRD